MFRALSYEPGFEKNMAQQKLSGSRGLFVRTFLNRGRDGLEGTQNQSQASEKEDQHSKRVEQRGWSKIDMQADQDSGHNDDQPGNR